MKIKFSWFFSSLPPLPPLPPFLPNLPNLTKLTKLSKLPISLLPTPYSHARRYFIVFNNRCQAHFRAGQVAVAIFESGPQYGANLILSNQRSKNRDSNQNAVSFCKESTTHMPEHTTVVPHTPPVQ